MENLTVTIFKRFALGSLMLLLLPLTPLTVAADPQNVTATERALLPEYCQHTREYENPNNMTPKGNYWLSKFGADLWHLHHYCWSHIHWNRAHRYGQTKIESNHEFSLVINEIGYVIRNTAPNFILRPELFHRSGQASVRIKKYRDAMVFFQKAIEAKTDYWPPYLEIADLLWQDKKIEEAKEVLSRGLPYMPENNPRIEKLRKELKL